MNNNNNSNNGNNQPMTFCKSPDCKTNTFLTPYCELHLSQLYGVKVQTSLLPNAGNGLFATQIFKRNQRIAPYDGTRSFVPTFGDYVLEYKTNCYIDCESTKTCCAGRFINDPRNSKLINCMFIYDKKEDRVWVVSTKHINIGEELYLSYGDKEYWEAKNNIIY